MPENKNEEEKEEKIIDIKGTFEEFIEEEKPEISQEEAIKTYKEYQEEKQKGTKKIKKTNATSDDDELEDDDHLKRIKRELLESLKRVEIMEKKIFEEKRPNKAKKSTKENVSKTQVQNKDKVIEQMRPKVQGDNERERSRE